MEKELSLYKIITSAAFLLIFLTSCESAREAEESPKGAFVTAKSSYDDENYEIALTKLGEFKTRYPYSIYAVEAELLIANSYFGLGRYIESASTYKQFVKLHPQHAKVPFAMFRVGESYWADAPEEADREQELTALAVEEWEGLIESYPKSKYAKEAKTKVNLGKLRIARAEEFVASYYCKQELWHACAYRYTKLAEMAPAQFVDIIRSSLSKASWALHKLADSMSADEISKSDKNLYFKNMSKKQLLKRSKVLGEQARKLERIGKKIR